MNRTRCNDSVWTPTLWKNSFESLFEQELDYGDEWSLAFNYRQTDQVTEEERKRGWKVFKYCAGGRFDCSSCSNGWFSAKVTLVFRYRLRPSAEKGTVILRPFGQCCRTCGEGDFYLPGFAKNDVDTTLLALFVKIRKNCYKEAQSDVPTAVCDNVKKTKPHERELCEACQDGICCLDEQ